MGSDDGELENASESARDFLSSLVEATIMY